MGRSASKAKNITRLVVVAATEPRVSCREDRIKATVTSCSDPRDATLSTLPKKGMCV